MDRHDEPSPSRPLGLPYRLLERAATGALLLVLAALGWMVAAAYFPDSTRLSSAEVEVIVTIGLLLAGLCLVSVVALMHTRK